MDEIKKIKTIEKIQKVKTSQKESNSSFQELLNNAINKHIPNVSPENSKQMENSALFYGLPVLTNSIKKPNNLPNAEIVKKKIEEKYNIDSIKNTQPKNKI